MLKDVQVVAIVHLSILVVLISKRKWWKRLGQLKSKD